MLFPLAGCLLIFLLGCGPSAQVTVTGGPSISQAQAQFANHNKFRIAVMGFENKTKYDVGRGMKAMLTTSLFRTNRFIVIEREELRDVLLEQKLGATGIVSKETAVPMNEVEGAQVLIYGTVTEFKPYQRGVTTIVGGVNQAHVAIDMKLVDAKTSRILATTTVEGKTADVNLSSEMLKYMGMSPLYYLKIYNNTPIGSAIRLCIDHAVDYIVTRLD
jgi:curli biogenesis system outer membrane secretion channel CsgG